MTSYDNYLDRHRHPGYGEIRDLQPELSLITVRPQLPAVGYPSAVPDKTSDVINIFHLFSRVKI